MPSTNSSIAARRTRITQAAQAAGLAIGADLLPTGAAPPAVIHSPEPPPVAATPVAAAPAPVVAPVAAPAPPPTTAAVAPIAPVPGALSADEIAHLRMEAAAAAQLQTQLTSQAEELATLRQSLLQAAPAPAATTPSPTPTQAPAGELAALQAQLAAAKQELAAATRPRLSADTWTSTDVDFSQAQALWAGFEPLINRLVDERAGELMQTRLAAAIDPLRSQVTQEVTDVRQVLARNDKSKFEQSVLAALPAAETIVPSVAFKAFLAQSIPHMGQTYAEVFQRHISGHNTEGVVHVLKQYLASAPGQNQPVVVDVPAAPAGLPSSALPVAAPQIEDLTALRKQFQRREISPEDYRNRLAAAEQILRSPAAHLRH